MSLLIYYEFYKAHTKSKNFKVREKTDIYVKVLLFSSRPPTDCLTNTALRECNPDPDLRPPRLVIFSSFKSWWRSLICQEAPCQLKSGAGTAEVRFFGFLSSTLLPFSEDPSWAAPPLPTKVPPCSQSPRTMLAGRDFLRSQSTRLVAAETRKSAVVFFHRQRCKQ